MDSTGMVFNPSVSIPADHPAAMRHPDRFVDADVSELELRERQGALIAEDGIAAKQWSAAQLAAMERQRREARERDREEAERRGREAIAIAMGSRLVADSRLPVMEANALHPDVARAYLIARALDARSGAGRGDVEDVIPGEVVRKP
jgi:hypothetical protein